MSQTLLRPDTPALRTTEGYAASPGRAPGERSERPRRAAWAAIVTVAAIVGEGGLGLLIRDGLERDFRTLIVVGSLLALVLAVLADISIAALGRRLTPWERRS